MATPDDFSTYVTDLLEETYDCVDRISLRGYFPLGHTSGGLLTWWNQLFPGTPLTQEGNCFVGGSDLAAINRLAEGLDGAHGLALLASVVDRWVYSACLCFALTLEGQHRWKFHYQRVQREMLSTLRLLKLVA